MGYGYGVELKKRVLAYLDAGHAKVEACQVFGVSRRAVYKWLELQTKTGQVLPPRRGQRRRKLDKEQLLKVLAQHPDAYAREVGHRH